MNIKTILAIIALAVFSVAHAKDQPTKSTSSAATSTSQSPAPSADQKKPSAAPAASQPAQDNSLNQGHRLKKPAASRQL